MTSSRALITPAKNYFQIRSHPEVPSGETLFSPPCPRWARVRQAEQETRSLLASARLRPRLPCLALPWAAWPFLSSYPAVWSRVEGRQVQKEVMPEQRISAPTDPERQELAQLGRPGGCCQEGSGLLSWVTEV